MRSLLTALMLLGAPAHAWEFTANPICTLSHEGAQAEVRLTYDPRGPLYAITLTRNTRTWGAGPVFAISFEGARSLTITTNRHTLSARDRALTVTDRGFSNVLDGLEFNDTATARLGDQALVVSLAGAAAPVAAFRACVKGGTV